VDNPQSKAWIFYGDGEGGFTRTELATGFDFHEARVVDANGDGPLDIVSKPFAWKTPRIDVWLNEGNAATRAGPARGGSVMQPAENTVASPARPKTGEIRIKGHYEHAMSRWHTALWISDPWHDGDYFLYRMPEGFSCNGQRYFAQPQGTGSWPTVQPEAAPEWRLDDTQKSTDYTMRFYDGVELTVEARAGPDEVAFRYIIRNNTASEIQPGSGSCFMIWTAPHFVDRRQDRTFVWVDGEPVALSSIPPTPAGMKRWPFALLGVGEVKKFEENKVRWNRHRAADHGLVCVQSQDRTKTIGLAWPQAHMIFARSTIPCLHSEPAYPPVPAGRALEVTGRLYFSTDGIAAVQRRFAKDTENGVLRAALLP
ncbi:MAG: FG-GAP repeat domain-containing protein, partial [Opitutaceae bacterium]